jgi:hypothetical protein
MVIRQSDGAIPHWPRFAGFLALLAATTAACDPGWEVGRAAIAGALPQRLCVEEGFGRTDAKITGFKRYKRAVDVYVFESALGEGGLHLDGESATVIKVRLSYSGLGRIDSVRGRRLKESVDALYTSLARACPQWPPLSSTSELCLRADCK